MYPYDRNADANQTAWFRLQWAVGVEVCYLADRRENSLSAFAPRTRLFFAVRLLPLADWAID